jgi:hypothetical protein
MIEQELELILERLWNGEIDIAKSQQLILRLFSVRKRYSLDYLDSMRVEQSVELWAKDQYDALDELKKIDANATYIFISKL